MRVALKAHSPCAFLIKVKPNATLSKRTQFFIFSIFVSFFLLIIINAAADLSDNYCQ